MFVTRKYGILYYDYKKNAHASIPQIKITYIQALPGQIFHQTMNSFKAQDACFPTHTDFDHDKTAEDRTVQNKGINLIYIHISISTRIQMKICMKQLHI